MAHRRRLSPPCVTQNGDTKGIGEEIVEVEDEGEFEGEDAVIDLTDATFEELTQAATGATTGDWVVMFYAPWYVFTCSCAAPQRPMWAVHSLTNVRRSRCGHCKKLHPTFSRVSLDLKGKVNIAHVRRCACWLPPRGRSVSSRAFVSDRCHREHGVGPPFQRARVPHRPHAQPWQDVQVRRQAHQEGHH